MAEHKVSTPGSSTGGSTSDTQQSPVITNGSEGGYYYGNQHYNYGSGNNNKYKNYNRQNYSNNNGGVGMSGNSNRQHYNRKNYNQKMNHNNHYNAYKFPANMYAYGYFPPPYGYSAPMMPGIPPMLPFPQQAPFSPMASGKVKVTDKEGKQVNLEEKRKITASNTPVSSPSPGFVSPVTVNKSPVASQHSVNVSCPPSKSEGEAHKSPQASPSSSSLLSENKAQPSASKLSVAEEFKRKILERAAKASSQKTEEQKSTELKEKKEDSGESQTPKLDDTSEKASVDKEATSNIAEEKLTENKAEEDKKVEKKVEEKVVEPVSSEPAAPAEEEVISDVGKSSKDVGESVASVDSKEETSGDILEKGDTSETSEKLAEKDISKPEVGGEAKVDDSKDKEADPERNVDDHERNKEGGCTMTEFFEKLKTADVVEDPFTFEYPQPFVNVDPSLKSGKLKYDAEFMSQFRDVIHYPSDAAWKAKLEGLSLLTMKRTPSSQSSRGPRAGAVGGHPLPGRFGNFSNRGQFNDGRTSSRSGSKRKGGSVGPRERSMRKGQSKRGGDKDKEKEEETKPVEEVKPLEKSANRWVPRSRLRNVEVKRAPDGSEIYDESEIERRTKSYLNKLTLEMFDKITDDLLTLATQSRWEDDAKTCRQIISLTFAKACDEPHWSFMYAQFCAKMCTQISDEIKDVNIRLRNGEYARGGDLARRILLTTCQTEYEKGWSDKLPTKEDGTPLEPEMMSDEYYQMAAAKRRGLGLVRFIGHLYTLNMLNDQVILLCLRDQSSNTKDPSEDSLENLAQLVNTVGERLEATEKNRAVLSFVFDNIQTILDNVKLSSRIRFMLMDLQDLRANKWKPLKAESGPKTIQEIHSEAEIKKIEEEKAAAERRRKNKSNEKSNSSRTGLSWGGQGKRTDPGNSSRDPKIFTSVPSMRSLSSRPNNSSDSNSSPLRRENSKRTDSILSNANMFAALGGADEENNDDDENRDVEAGNLRKASVGDKADT